MADLKASGIVTDAKKQIVALIAYMHKLGRDISDTPENLMAMNTQSNVEEGTQQKEVKRNNFV